jgi:hypothetical protein
MKKLMKATTASIKNFWSSGAAFLELQFSCKKEVMLFMDINEMSKNKWSEG